MIDSFIQEVLQIQDYNLVQHKSGKDNLTYEILCGGENFIIQQLSITKSKINQDFIDQVITYTNLNIPGVGFADKKYENRFFTYNSCQFQVMEKLSGETISGAPLDKEIIQKTAKYIANFHKGIRDLDISKYSEVNYFKKLKLYERQAGDLIENSKNPEIINIYNEMSAISKNLHEDHSLTTGVIHGDPSFKNFLVDKQDNIVGLIDYDMMSVNAFIWDLADMIRSYLKCGDFDKKSFKLLVNSYNEVRKLPTKETENLESYCKMCILDTGLRYIISYFENTNLLGGKDDCLNKAQRCLDEIDKINTFFN